MSHLHTLYLTGRILDGRAPDEVSKALAKLTGLSPAQAAAKLQGRESLLKRELTATQLPRYLQAMQTAGVEVRVDPPQPNPRPAAEVALATSAPTPTSPALEIVGIDPANTVTCPACQTEQPRRTLCLNCGADMPRMLAAQEAEQQVEALSPYAAPTARVADSATADTVTPSALSFSMQGRIGRLRYLAYTLPAMAPAIAIGFFSGLIGSASASPVLLIGGITIGVVATWIMMLRIMVLRLHDLNLSGKWCLITLLPVVMLLTGLGLTGLIAFGVIYLIGGLYLLLRGGSAEENEFGSPPGPNTVWTVLGAVLVLALTLIGQIKGQADQKKLLERLAHARGQQTEQSTGE